MVFVKEMGIQEILGCLTGEKTKSKASLASGGQ